MQLLKNEYNAALVDLATATAAADAETAAYNAKQSVLNQAYLKESELNAKLDAAKRAHQAYLDTKRAAETGVVNATNAQHKQNTQSTAKNSDKKETEKRKARIQRNLKIRIVEQILLVQLIRQLKKIQRKRVLLTLDYQLELVS